jgi:sortase A
MRTKSIVSILLSLVLIGAGVTLIGFFFLDQSSGSTVTKTRDIGSLSVPDVGTGQKGAKEATAGGPKDKTLTVTIPKMSRVKNATVPYTTGDDEKALRDNPAIHLKGTGFPWQKGANVYLAGHRLGYAGTDSFLAFYDLNKLGDGDKVFVTDAAGKKYTYRVFKEFVVDPTDLSVTKPVPGKNVLTLQTCTLPDYTKRLIVRAELVS